MTRRRYVSDADREAHVQAQGPREATPYPDQPISFPAEGSLEHLLGTASDLAARDHEQERRRLVDELVAQRAIDLRSALSAAAHPYTPGPLVDRRRHLP